MITEARYKQYHRPQNLTRFTLQIINIKIRLITILSGYTVQKLCLKVLYNSKMQRKVSQRDTAKVLPPPALYSTIHIHNREFSKILVYIKKKERKREDQKPDKRQM